jgi:hypothetical protein
MPQEASGSLALHLMAAVLQGLVVLTGLSRDMGSGVLEVGGQDSIRRTYATRVGGEHQHTGMCSF